MTPVAIEAPPAAAPVARPSAATLTARDDGSPAAPSRAAAAQAPGSAARAKPSTPARPAAAVAAAPPAASAAATAPPTDGAAQPAPPAAPAPFAGLDLAGAAAVGATRSQPVDRPSPTPAAPSIRQDTSPAPASIAPAGQVAAAVARLAVGQGTARLELSLQPEALGRVQIRIDRAADGSAAVTVQVERPETLAALHRDSSQLQAALDRAGFSHARSVEMTLAPPPEPARPAATPAAPQDAAAGASSGGQGSAGEQDARRQPRARAPAGAADLAALDPISASAIRTPGGPRRRDAVDITA